MPFMKSLGGKVSTTYKVCVPAGANHYNVVRIPKVLNKISSDDLDNGMYGYPATTCFVMMAGATVLSISVAAAGVVLAMY